MEALISLSQVFLLVFLAEFGDKSQLVAMTLAARYRPFPIIVGAIAAFAVLNILGVLFGASVAQWLPSWAVALAVAVLFLYFGWQSLRVEEDDEDEDDVKVGRQLLLSVFLLIFLAEFGDKTQLAVAAMGGIHSIVPVWLGATLALSLTTVLGVLVGHKLLKHVPLHLIHKGSGVLFILFGIAALLESWQQWLVV